MNLTPLTNRINDIRTIWHKGEADNEGCLKLIFKTTDAGELPLELGQFMPCKEGKPLEYPSMDDIKQQGTLTEGWDSIYARQFKEYQQALSNVLFKGWEVRNVNVYSVWITRGKIDLVFDLQGMIIPGELSPFKTIEDVSEFNLELTQEGEKRML